MDSSWFDRYVSAWLLHALAGAPDGQDALSALLDCYSPDVVYEDVPTATVFSGREGVARMCEGAYNWSSDVRAKVVTQQTNGTLFAVETEWTGTNTAPVGDIPATGRTFMNRMLSVGAVNENGHVIQHRDYWDLTGFLTQIGVQPTPQ